MSTGLADRLFSLWCSYRAAGGAYIYTHKVPRAHSSVRSLFAQKSAKFILRQKKKEKTNKLVSQGNLLVCPECNYMHIQYSIGAE